MGYLAMLFGVVWIAVGVWLIKTVYTDWQLAVVLTCLGTGCVLLFIGGGIAETQKLIKARLPPEQK